MKSIKKFSVLVLALGLSASFVTPTAKAAIGLISMIGGPSGIGLVQSGAILIGAGMVSDVVLDAAHELAPNRVNADAGLVVETLLVWPGIFLLDHQVHALPPISGRDLSDNGYTGQQIAGIFADAKMLDEKLASERKFIEITNGETAQSIRDGLERITQSLSLNVTPEFLDVYSDHLSIQSQAN